MKLSDELIVKIATDFTLKAYSDGDLRPVAEGESPAICLAKSVSLFFNTVVDEISKAQK